MTGATLKGAERTSAAGATTLADLLTGGAARSTTGVGGRDGAPRSRGKERREPMVAPIRAPMAPATGPVSTTARTMDFALSALQSEQGDGLAGPSSILPTYAAAAL